MSLKHTLADAIEIEECRCFSQLVLKFAGLSFRVYSEIAGKLVQFQSHKY